MQRNQTRMEVLDAMRGVAALLVVLYHAKFVLYRAALVPNGYLAVDFFFMLSGLVISQSYSHKLNSDLSIINFIKIRVIRLYPLYFIGLIFGVFQIAQANYYQTNGAIPPANLASSFLFELFMVPSPFSDLLFPINIPAWSLFSEMVINILFATHLVKAKIKHIYWTTIISGTLLTAIAINFGEISLGFKWDSIHFALIRVTFSFSLGILIYRLNLHQKIRLSFKACAIPLLTLIIVLMAKIPTGFQAIFDVVSVMFVFPIMVVWAASCASPVKLKPISDILGQSSYAIYIIHHPLLFIVAIPLRFHHISALIWLPGFFLFLIYLAVFLDKHYDKPARTWMQKKLLTQNRSSEILS